MIFTVEQECDSIRYRNINLDEACQVLKLHVENHSSVKT